MVSTFFQNWVFTQYLGLKIRDLWKTQFSPKLLFLRTHKYFWKEIKNTPKVILYISCYEKSRTNISSNVFLVKILDFLGIRTFFLKKMSGVTMVLSNSEHQIYLTKEIDLSLNSWNTEYSLVSKKYIFGIHNSQKISTERV